MKDVATIRKIHTAETQLVRKNIRIHVDVLQTDETEFTKYIGNVLGERRSRIV